MFRSLANDNVNGSGTVALGGGREMAEDGSGDGLEALPCERDQQGNQMESHH